jgi:hypothetical protein
MTMKYKNTAIAILTLMGATLVSAETANVSTAANQPIVISTDFSEVDPGIFSFGSSKRNWRVEDGVLKTVGNLALMSDFSVVGEPGWQDYEVEFKVKRIEVNPADQHFGIFLRSDQEDVRKATSSFRFYFRADKIYFTEMSEGKEVRNKLLGELPAPMETGENAAWITFRIVVKGNQAEVYVDGMLVGEVNEIVPTSGAIIFYAYNLNLWLDDLKVIVTRPTDKP